MNRTFLGAVGTVAIVGAVTAAAALTAPANAKSASAPSPPGLTVTATRQAAAPNSTAAPAAASVITCTLSAGQYPHKSSHVPGTINYVATASCDAPVVRVTVAATLQGPIPLAPVHGTPGSGTISAQSNAAMHCYSGRYFGYATMTVTFPPGYSPNPQTTNGTGPTVNITC